MNRIWIPVLVAAAAFSTNAFADHRWDDDDDREHRHRHHHRHHHHHHHHHRVEHVTVQPAYVEPQVIYVPPPRVIYRERVVYRDRPVVVEAAPRYPAPYYEERAAPASNGNRVIGQAIGAVAGGVIGNQFGQGNGKVVATAAGAVIGSVVGGNMAGERY